MRMPLWLLRLLPMWDYICPKCKKEVKQKTHKCPHCGENYGIPLRVPPKVLKDTEVLEEYVHKHIFPKVSASHREYLTQFFTVLFKDGFESGTILKTDVPAGAWDATSIESGASLSVSSTVAHHGTYSLKSITTNEADHKTAEAQVAFATADELWHRFYVYIDGDDNIFNIGAVFFGGMSNVGWGVFCQLGINGATRKLFAGNYPSSTGAARFVTSETVVLAQHKWYCLELDWLHAISGNFRAYVDSVEITDVEDSGFDNTGYDIVRANVGTNQNYRGPGDLTIYTDCVVVADRRIGGEVEPSFRNIKSGNNLCASFSGSETG